MGRKAKGSDGAVEQEPTVRLDLWLWAARWYKTRRLALEAVQRGHVRSDGQLAKASKAVRRGTRLTITRAAFTYHVEVRALADKRRGAKEAALLYEEDEASVRERAQVAAKLRLARLATPTFDGKGRPSKKDGRDLRKLKGDW